MEKHFMIDIESTGIDPAREDLLSVGLLEVTWDSSYWTPGRSFEMLAHTAREPESEFAKTHMVELYRRCQATPVDQRHTQRSKILSFFRECGTKNVEDTYVMGWNASNFDVPFLMAKGILEPNGYQTGPDGKDRMVGDVHYRIYEIGGAVSLAQNIFGEADRKRLTERAREAGPPIVGVDGKEHDALYDCYRQLRMLNGLIEMIREAR